MPETFSISFLTHELTYNKPGVFSILKTLTNKEMEDSSYERALIESVGKAAYNKHREALWAVDRSRRRRVVTALQLGLNIPRTLSHVQLSAILPDESFNRYIRYVAVNLLD